MKIVYHTAHDWKDEHVKIMNSYGLYPKLGFSSIQIEEEKYKQVEKYLLKWFGNGGIAYSDFTNLERNDAEISVKVTGHTFGYPMPNLDFGYRLLTYDLSLYCESCGVGLKQKDSFRLKNVPKEGKKEFFGIGWVFDEYFVQRKIYDEVFKPLEIDCREVLSYKKDQPFESTVQLIIPESTEELNYNSFSFEECNKCGRIKYQAMPLDFYPKPNEIIAPIFKSYEYFGSGSSAFKRIFVTKDLRDKLIKLKVDNLNWYIPTR